jgi:glycosyltransferase involved in cell wall biosynthesis
MRVAVTLEQCWHAVPGGTAVSALELVRSLDERGDVDVVGVSARHRTPPAEQWTPSIPVRALPLPRSLLYETWHAPMARGPRVERATGPVDVVHATAIAFPAARAPVVVTVHDLAFLDDPSRATRHGHRFFRRGAELARRHAVLVMVPSRATLDACVAFGFDSARLRHVPWGVRANAVAPADVQRAKAAYGIDRRYVVFAGTVEPRKNLQRLLAAFARVDHDDTDLVVAGPTGWNESIAPGALLDGRVRTLGFVPRADLDALMAGSAAVCYPSIEEGFGLPVLEAMAQGAPTITSKGTATEEVAGDAALLVDPLDVDAIAGAIDDVLRDADLAARLGAAGRARAASYTWERTAALAVDVYREASGG